MKCTNSQIDVLKEIVNVGVGKVAKLLNAMLNSHISLQVPSLKILLPDELEMELSKYTNEQLFCVNLPFNSTISGVAELVFSAENASKFVTALTNEQVDTDDMNSIRAGTLTEIGNIVLNAVMGNISNFLGLKFRYSIPTYTEGDFSSLIPVCPATPDVRVVVVHACFVVEKLKVEGNIILFFEEGSFDRLLEELEVSSEEAKRP